MGSMLSTGQVASALGVTINTVKAWIHRGRLEAIRLPSGHYRIPEGELRRLLGADRREARGRWDLPETDDSSVEDRVDWALRMLAEAERHGHLPEEPIEETVAHLAHVRRALAAIRT